MVLSTEEADPVEGIGGASIKTKEPVMAGSKEGEKTDENSSVEDEKKQEDETPQNEEAPSEPATTEADQDSSKKDDESPDESSGMQESSPEEQDAVEKDSKQDAVEESPARAEDERTEEVKSTEEALAETEVINEKAIKETKEENESEENVEAASTHNVEQQGAADDGGAKASEQTKEDTQDVEAGTVLETGAEAPEEAVAEPTTAAAAAAPVTSVPMPDDAPTANAPTPENAPTASDGTQGGDIEEGIPSDDTNVETAPDPPEPPSREKELTVEHGVPPETPARDEVKKGIDPESPSRETEADDSFDSMEPVNGDHDLTVKKSKRRRKHFIFGTVCILIIVGSVLGILYGTGVVGGSGEPSPSTSSPSPPGDEVSPPPASPGDVAPPPAPADGDVSQTNPPTTPVQIDDPLWEVLKGFGLGGLNDLNSPQFKAYEWMANADPLSDETMDPSRLQQRYSLATLLMSLKGEIPFYATRDDCTWPIVECNTDNAPNGTQPWQVTDINMAGSSLSGTIPPEVGLLAPSLVSIDMAENPDLTGSIPEELYTATNLKYLYLSNNAMTGTLSESIANMQSLDSLYLGGNKFSGPIPYNLGSRSSPARPMRKFFG